MFKSLLNSINKGYYIILMALLHLHRLPQTSITPAKQRHSADICHVAASSTSKLFNDILSTERIGQCSFTSLTLLLATAIQISHEARLAAYNSAAVLSIQAQGQLEQILPVLSAISCHWSSAEAIGNLYEDLLKQFKRQMLSSFDFQAPGLLPEFSHYPNQSGIQESFQTMENDSLGSGGNLGTNLQALFTEDQTEALLDIDTEAIIEWLAISMNNES